jgi:FKBP-type peptidyl-prolyl cis-trans isomerase 2
MGVKRPRLAHLCKIVYTAYFYDHEVFDHSHGKEMELYLGDIAWPEGLWRGIQEMRKGEHSKIRMKKKFAFGRPGAVDKLRFPKGFSEEPEDAERRTKLTTKSVIYEVTLIDWVERIDVDAQG